MGGISTCVCVHACDLVMCTYTCACVASTSCGGGPSVADLRNTNDDNDIDNLRNSNNRNSNAYTGCTYAWYTDVLIDRQTDRSVDQSVDNMSADVLISIYLWGER